MNCLFIINSAAKFFKCSTEAVAQSVRAFSSQSEGWVFES